MRAPRATGARLRAACCFAVAPKQGQRPQPLPLPLLLLILPLGLPLCPAAPAYPRVAGSGRGAGTIHLPAGLRGLSRAGRTDTPSSCTNSRGSRPLETQAARAPRKAEGPGAAGHCCVPAWRVASARCLSLPLSVSFSASLPRSLLVCALSCPVLSCPVLSLS